jgi:outer membrane protein TolC
VRNAFQAISSAEACLEAATASRESAEKLYESEQRKLQIGASTVYMALERQQALVNARGAELEAQTTLNKAIATSEKLQWARWNSFMN